MTTTVRTVLLTLAVFCAPEVARAQDFSAILQDGRVVTVARSSIPCGEPDNLDEPPYALALAFGCDDAISGTGGEGALLVARDAGQSTPREYLIHSGLRYAPDSTPDERAGLLVDIVATLGSGRVNMVCMPVENEDGTGGEVTCVLDQPRTQLIVAGRSFDASRALGVVTMFLSTVAIR